MVFGPVLLHESDLNFTSLVGYHISGRGVAWPGLEESFTENSEMLWSVLETQSQELCRIYWRTYSSRHGMLASLCYFTTMTWTPTCLEYAITGTSGSVALPRLWARQVVTHPSYHSQSSITSVRKIYTCLRFPLLLTAMPHV